MNVGPEGEHHVDHPDHPRADRFLALGGAPGPAIVQSAHGWNADMIVMGTHGRTGLSRLLMGSVAEHVVRHASCPVLTIKLGAAHDLSEEEPTQG